MSWKSFHDTPRTQEFRVPGLWGVHLYTYAASVWMDGVRMEVRPGMAGFTPPGAVMRYRFSGPSTHLFVHLAFPEDSATVDVPALMPLGDDFLMLWELLEPCIGWREQNPERASARAWDVYLAMLDLATGSSADAYPAPVHQAIRLVEESLAGTVSPLVIADQLAMSQTHLARLFRRHLNCTVLEFARHKRAERARYLLQTSDIPVKQVAQLVGVSDIQAFNKLVRRTFGVPPRALRAKEV